MTRFLLLKHWQLFLLLIGPPIILDFILFETLFTSRNLAVMTIAFPIVMLFTTSIFFGWFYAIGTYLHHRLPSSVNMNLTTFKIFLSIPAIYIALLCIFIFTVFLRNVNNGSLRIGIAAVMIPVHLFSMFCILYCLYFIAKVLKAVELQRPVTFSDFAGEFLLIWFFPIGVWIIQPRINKLFNDNLKTTNTWIQ